MDPSRLELTPYPWKVHPCEGLVDKEDDKVFRNGFIVTYRVNVFDAIGAKKVVVEDDEGIETVLRKKCPPFPFKCNVHSANTLKVVVPLLDHSDRGNDDEFIREKHGRDHILMNALDEHRNECAQRNGQDYNTTVKHVILQFPETVALDGECLGVNKKKKKKGFAVDPTSLKLEAINISVDITTALDDNHDTRTETTLNAVGQEQQQIFTLWKQSNVPRFFWRVADTSQDSKKRGGLDNDSSEDEEVEGAAAMMSAAKIR